MKLLLKKMLCSVVGVAASCMISSLPLAAQRVQLIERTDQLTTNCAYGTETLLDDDPATAYYTWDGELPESPYIQVKLDSPVRLKTGEADPADNEDLVVMVQRCKYSSDKQPTSLHVELSMDGTRWEHFCYVHFLYRGASTKEYSVRVATEKEFQYMRFTVIANNTKSTDSQGHRRMSLGGFQVYKLGHTENYSETLRDRFHLLTDYDREYEDYEFMRTNGILDSHNVHDWFKNEVSGFVNGKWSRDIAYLARHGVNIPDYSPVSSTPGSSNYDRDLEPGQERQPTHVIEHVLYAIPGDVIALYPYYGMPETGNYEEKFIHWYDYRTGGRLQYDLGDHTHDLLDFLTDPSHIHVSDKYGFYGGRSITRQQVIPIRTPKEYIDFVRRVNGGERLLNISIEADLDFDGYTVEPLCYANKGLPFRGYINGNGHRITNLKINMPESDNVGLVGVAGYQMTLCNLYIDKSCSFVGHSNVGVIGYGQSNTLKIYRVDTEASVEATDTPTGERKGWAGALMGYASSNIDIQDCHAGGTVKGKGAAAIAGRLTPGTLLKHTYTDAEVKDSQAAAFYYTTQEAGNVLNSNNIVASFGPVAAQGLAVKPADNATLLAGLGGNWTMSEALNRPVPKMEFKEMTVPADDLRKHGTVATFFCPRNAYAEAAVLGDLPFREMDKKVEGVANDHDEFIIAADFSLDELKGGKRIDAAGKKIYEPIVHYRHLFRIRDGKAFAEEFSGSAENNEAYVRKNMRFVSARDGVPFQIRLDSPVPVYEETKTPRSKYYYKISDSDYRRVCSMGIEVYDADTREKLANPGFVFTETFNGQGSRVIDGVTYNTCAGGGRYYRFLAWSAPKAGRYIVRVIGHDINDDIIKVYDPATGGPSKSDNLIVMEYIISFLPETAASMVTEDQLYSKDDKYKHAREEELDRNYGEPRDRVTFDEFRFLEKADSVKTVSNYLKQRYKDKRGYAYAWPMVWDRSTYVFGYNNEGDYNMYVIANHSDQVEYKAAVNKVTGNAGLYDRLYYKTRRLHKEDPERYPESTLDQGYFYYVNAATEPGVMARLDVRDMCLGSTVHVSAWVAEFSDRSETANIAFNFVAVMKETGERIPVHSFVSGYVKKVVGDDLGQCGRWLNIYYSFVPDFTHASLSVNDIDHYELELDNNCKNSQGADYAVDNIRIYIIRPVLYAQQAAALCNDLKKNVRVKVEAPFSVMLQTIGATETPEQDAQIGTDHNIYYTFIDKKKFDDTYAQLVAAGDPDAGANAYDAAVLRYNYRGGTEEQTFGVLTFNTKYSTHQPYDPTAPLRAMASRETAADSTRMIVFNTEPQDDQLQAGKEYYISMYVPIDKALATDDFVPKWEEFDIFDHCAKYSTFRVYSSNVVKIDGVVRGDVGNIAVCEDQSPVAQVNIWGQLPNGELREVDKNAYIDWYEGSIDEFRSIKVADEAGSAEGLSTLEDALYAFRTCFPAARTVDADEIEAAVKAGTVSRADFTEAMQQLLTSLTTPKAGERSPKLQLMKSSYVFPPTVANEEGRTEYSVVAIPVEMEKKVGDYTVKICTDPTEICVKVENPSPSLLHGLNKNFTYPDWMADVPLRVGLRQLKAVSYNPETQQEEPATRLNIPVRRVADAGATPGVTGLCLKAGSPYIYLVETNDPAYKDLGVTEDEGLMPVGEICSLTARIDEAGTRTDNAFSAVFYDSMDFKEGYYYRMRFNFEEEKDPAAPQAGADGNTDQVTVVCDGQDVFTLKVVPEYQRWIGKADNRNWNNDGNWSRVAYSELYRAGADAGGAVTDEYVTDGDNPGVSCYAPLDFTKVIVDADAPSPYLYETATTDMTNTYPDLPENNSTVFWPSAPDPADGLPAAIGSTTANIQYDMAAYNSIAENGGVRCRPWYAHTCAQVHFRPGAAMMGQRHLAYRKAWVDMELDPARWYTLASPLQGIVAGDLYLPSDNARQETPLFTDIFYSEELNHRFRPAVYQRGWNKGQAIVYELDGSQRDVALKADWSHVYNDVEEVYAAGTGFSVKTDVDALKAAPQKVLFRLPKADESYLYYTQDFATDGSGSKGTLTDISRQGQPGRLNPVSGTLSSVTQGEKKYFFVGNPFMAHLDMAKFFSANSGKINNKYWLVTGSTQSAGVFLPDGMLVGDASAYVAPLQGFFVEAKDGAAVADGDGLKLELDYNESMVADVPTEKVPLLAPGKGRAAVLRPGMTITALVDGMAVSSAVLVPDAQASADYQEAEDMTVMDHSGLGVPATVYTLAGHRAVTVNRLAGAERIGIGVIAGEGAATILRFDGVTAFADMELLDTATGESTPLSEGMEYAVEGPCAGRLFLTKAAASASVASAMRCTVENRVLTVYAGEGEALRLRVCDAAGRTVYAGGGEARELSVPLERGVYVVEAADGAAHLVEKVMVR